MQLARLRQSYKDLLLLAAAAMLLLILPDEAMGPLQALNPYKIWLIVVLLLGIGTLGQLVSQRVGLRHGLPLAGFISGFVSSTATVMALGLQVKKHPASHAPAVAGAVLSSVATYVQMAMLLAALSLPLFYKMLPPLLAGVLASALYSIFFIRRSARSVNLSAPSGKPIITLKAALGMAGLIALIGVAVVWLNHSLGEKGIWLGAAIAGLSDAHAAGATLAALVNAGTLEAGKSVIPVMLGFTSNTLLRMALSATAGSHVYAREVIPGLAIGLVAAWAGALFVLL